MNRAEFPITGVVGVVHGTDREVDDRLGLLEAAPWNVGGLEVRADLLPSIDAALAITSRWSDRWPVLFTLRRADEGGRYAGSEADRIEIYRRAFERGARLVDAELDSGTSRELGRRRVPFILSHHDFEGMPDAGTRARLMREATALSPRGLKLVPTAKRPADAVRMLEWVAAAGDSEPRRVAFAMGECGTFSRILSLAWGAPFTYGSLSGAVAPEQLAVRELCDVYRVSELTRSTRIFGVIGNPVRHSLSPHMHNAALKRRQIDAVYLPFALRTFSDLEELVEPLAVAGLSVTIPFKGEACRYATRRDRHSEVCGATNTLLFERGPGKPTQVAAWNTDVDGVLGPLRRRGIHLDGLSVALLGNGGAARGAAEALLHGGAAPTIYYRNKERGEPVAAALGIKARPMTELAAGDHLLVVNATPLGLEADDPSPVPASVFTPETIAFDMIYDPPETPFLGAARHGGARTLIAGREMLICQGLVQFRHFTGQEADYGEFERAFLNAQRERHETA